jgi:hypothetical protein
VPRSDGHAPEDANSPRDTAQEDAAATRRVEDLGSIIQQANISHPAHNGVRSRRVEVTTTAAVPLPDLVTPDEVAAWLKTTRKAVYAKAERGTLPGATYIGRRLYFFRSELLRCALQGRVPDMEK